MKKIRLLRRDEDIFTTPRPVIGAAHVALGTSFFMQLYIDGGDAGADKVDAGTLDVSLSDESGKTAYMVKNGDFGENYGGTLKHTKKSFNCIDGIDIYIEPKTKLRPNTKYTVRLSAASERGCGIDENDSSWSFATGDEDIYELSFGLDLHCEPVRWHGLFFSGIVRPDFNSPTYHSKARYDFLYGARKEYPRAWNLFRDFYLTGFDHQNPGYQLQLQPNIVRELETRRIVKIEEQSDGVLLTLADFYGHWQYGIESGRPLGCDYHKGDEVLISDGVILESWKANCVKSSVVSVNDEAGTVLVAKYDKPERDFRIEYNCPEPGSAPENLPGLFPYGGTYLRKFNPPGTPRYYWGRLDYSWDIMVGEYGQRIHVGFCDAPGDLSVDGGSWTYPKDYLELHKTTYDITCHLIERYGGETLNWVWSVFNEPDLWFFFWRSNDWEQLQIFYDYSTDAILRAFEDNGYDSGRVVIGGLELGACTGTDLKIREFLEHCSPNSQGGEGVVALNMAYADRRLDGKRSKRVEKLCAENGGKGSPVDFVSIHSYNRSDLAARKMIKAKDIALETDPVYYEGLWVNNYESCPDWRPFEDPGASHIYLGNGYFPSWIADVVSQRLIKAAKDSRYAHGESIFTVWPFPAKNLNSLVDFTREIHIDADGDGKEDRTEIIAVPAFHFVNLLSAMGDGYYPLGSHTVNGHRVSGFASKAAGAGALRVVLYSHDGFDVQSSSDSVFKTRLSISGIAAERVKAAVYRFDRENNSYYRYAKDNQNKDVFTEGEFGELKGLSQLKITQEENYPVGKSGHITIETELVSNAVSYIVFSEG